ncbi:hypothetical protein PY254_06640 [Rhodanobacter sp. AS-Z3]|uniref:hypothetical protein n=1 Tax=Rhodanobacter sp. AS-Z3 TaxID=3031330 RepID=UPI0024785C85|nr:hypothetical protein [Rhodanobacter sp. AS-Z3]WEN16834.1 hypothetical protein PY254_06640 [Rhodanobacter sp. AS-Z3]
MVLTAIIYSAGLSGGWLFDDYPNIVDNPGVQPSKAGIPALFRAAMSSPASEFKRPLASLSFAANYLASGLKPYTWKLTNLTIHMLNGLLVYWLARALLLATAAGAHPVRDALGNADTKASRTTEGSSLWTGCAPTSGRTGITAALIAAAWMLLPINLTAVLYVVQRMESMANLFVLIGLLGYVAGRCRMLAIASDAARNKRREWSGWLLCAVSITLPALVGMLAKETAVMLPLYALLVEWALFRWRKRGFDTVDQTVSSPESLPPLRVAVGQALPAVSSGDPSGEAAAWNARPKRDAQGKDWRVITLFLVVLVLPILTGLTWLLPGLLEQEAWATRNFTLVTRLLSEARIVTDYIGWTLLPTPDALSFYHDNFQVSTGILSPWTTLTSIVFLGAVIALLPWLRKRQPLVALGLCLFLGCQLLTGTILPLELIYEHRNYFASFGLLLALVPLLAVPRSQPLALPRNALLGGLILCWAALTGFTAYAWGDSLRLAEDLASRAPNSPRAQYELGRTYIIYSHYEPASPFTRLAYAPLETSAALPNSSILPEQALIFMNARMQLPLKDVWWDSMIDKLKAHTPGVQDESSLAALTQCARDRRCDLPTERMVAAFSAALAHPKPNPRLLATYGDYAWNVLNNRKLGLEMTAAAVAASPNEPAYQITLIRMLATQERRVEAEKALNKLANLNIGGRLDRDLANLRALPGLN